MALIGALEVSNYVIRYIFKNTCYYVTMMREIVIINAHIRMNDDTTFWDSGRMSEIP